MAMPSIVAKSLQGTLKDLEVRVVVEDTMQSMLTDVEIACQLEKDLTVEVQHGQLEFQAKASALALQESRAMQDESRENQSVLADSLVREIWSLSLELGNLRRWKKEHQHVVEHRDELVAKLLYAEETIEDLRSRKPTAATTSSSSNETTENSKKPAETTEDTAQDDKKMPSKEESDSKDAADTVEGTKEKNVGTERSAPSKTTDSPEQPSEVVALLEEDEEDKPSLEALEVETLLNIFGFLEPIEILSLAQVNVVMYSQVDSLFGSGNAAALDASRNEPSQPATPPQSTPTVVTVPPAPTVAAIPPTATVAAVPPATMATVPPATTATRVIVPPTKPAPQKQQGGLFSLLSARQQQQQQSQGGTDVRAKPRGVKQAGATHDRLPLNAAMATSLAAKLSDSELSAIISMTEKLRRKEQEAARLTKENQELNGKLDGTEGVKQFLIAKVREIEQTLQKSKQDETKVTQQIASDQEVIAFLDGRVQELERNSQVIVKDKKKLEDEMKDAQQRNEKKLAVMSDMLQYERERLAENEKDWKATKKLLVKEIKSCRAQIVTLQAERDGYKEQTERLKRVVLAPVSYNGSPLR